MGACIECDSPFEEEEGYRDQQSLEKGLVLARKANRLDLESELVDAIGRG
mgnify:CR=1 FL=1|jgi:hypothetical protein